MVDEKAAAQGINKAGSAVKDFFGFGDKKAEAKPESNYETEANKIAKEELKNGADTFNLEAIILEKLEKKFPKIDRQILEFHADVAATKIKSKKDVVSKETVDGKKTEYAGDIKVASATSAGALSSDPQFDKDIREHRKQARDVELKKPDQNYLDTTPDTKPGTGNYLDATPDTKPSIKPDNYLAPAKATPVGSDVARTSTENADMGREASKGGANNTVVSNNVSTNNTTTHVPIKATPRAESQGSALDRYQNRVSSFG